MILDVSLRRVRNKENIYYIPILLDLQQADAVSEYIAEFERCLGLSQDQIDNSHLTNILSDHKIRRGLFQSLTRSFYQLKGLDYDQNFAPWELRILMYKQMEADNQTWATYREQNELLENIKAKSEHLDNNESIKNYLFADHSVNFRIVRKQKEPPTPEDVIYQYNTDVVRFLFSKSYSINIMLAFSDISGEFIKKLVRTAKFSGIHFDFTRLNDQVQISLLGTLELVGRSTKYNKQLFKFSLAIIPLLLSSHIKELELEIQYYERRLNIVIPIENFPLLNQQDENQIRSFDSKVEENFYKYFTAIFPQWKIEQEPVIIESNIIMIPDFLLSYRGVDFYFEIVGYWSDKYLIKKVQKVNLLKHTYSNLIMLVDKSLDWPKDIGVTTFYYGKKFPLSQIGNYLKKQEIKPFNEFLENFDKSEITNKIIEKLKDKNYIVAEELLSIFGTYTKAETQTVCHKLFDNGVLMKLEAVLLIDEPVILRVKFLLDVQQKLKLIIPTTAIMLSNVEPRFSNLETRIFRRILSYLGYQIKFKSLLEEKLIVPAEDVIIKPSLV